ncbi:MAG: Uma2 family endonuclease [Lachnospiraceae bacterium]|jgi:Uma2 family endonuclease|nr:Uma2 family endonuclease [Lachnospiraceae bacterium]
MSLTPKKIYTSDDYWKLPEDVRAELINGQLYNMAPPSRIHQKLLVELCTIINNHIKSKRGICQVYPAPFAVNLDANNKDWVEPDISVICEPNKLTDKGCCGAPDLIIEILSPSSRKMDYIIKNALYSEAGVREYWIIDPQKETSLVYCFNEDAAPTMYPFRTPIPFGLFPDLSVTISNLLE